MSRLLVAQRALTVPGWAKNELWRRARAVPSLDLRFADNKSLVDAVTGSSLVTFTRASSGTFVGSDGLLRTATNDVARFDHNPTTGESLGLLVEEQRTNLLLNSATLSSQSVTVAAAANTLSFYGTGTVTLTGVSTAGPLVGTGANNRVSLTFTPTVGVLVLTVSGSVTNAQLEAGAFPTSYIPTTTAAATRSADVASITGSAFSGWYSQSEGTLFASGDFVALGANNFSRVIGLAGANTGTDEISFHTRVAVGAGDGSIFGAVTVNSSLEGSLDAPSGLPNLSAGYRSAIAYKANDFGLSSNGLTPTVDTSGTLPTITQLIIMGNVRFQNRLSGHVRRLTYWPQRLANSTLQQITQ